jgi:hypothetical protein
MRISFKTEGGVAHLPGLSRPVTIDTDELPMKKAGEVEQLIEAAGFFELSPTSALPRGGADYQKHTITVTTPERSHTVQLAGDIEDAHVRELVSRLSRLRAEKIKALLAARRRDTI